MLNHSSSWAALCGAAYSAGIELKTNGTSTSTPPVVTSPRSPLDNRRYCPCPIFPLFRVPSAADADAAGPAAAARSRTGTVPLRQIAELCCKRRAVEDYFDCFCAFLLLLILLIFAISGRVQSTDSYYVLPAVHEYG